jgi:preprotein translocase subunit SecE
VARSRQQRRERRAEAAGEPRANARAAAAPREARPAPEAPSVSQPRGGFIRESYAELKKVEWPSRPQVMTGTIVVIVAVTIVGLYLWLLDQGFKNLVEKLLI